MIQRWTLGRYAAVLAAATMVLVALLAMSPGIGTQQEVVGAVDAWKAWAAGDTHSLAYRIGFLLRLPRSVKAAVAGAMLALAGAVYQTLFRNPLATPYTLGVTSGASLGALLAFELGWVYAWSGLSTVTIAAFGGAIVVMGAILLLARLAPSMTGAALLLAGVTIGYFCSGLMMFVTYLADVQDTFSIVRWMMGSLDSFTMVDVKAMLIVVLPAGVVLFALARGLNQYVLGEEIAASRGVAVRRLEVTGILAGALGAAGVVSVCGPIGFVGLIVPHLVRLVAGQDHRIVLPLSALCGASFLIVCDFLTGLAPGWYRDATGHATTAGSLPIGVMTAIVGTPIFLVLLGTRLRSRT